MGTSPTRWLLRTTRTGITELPANAGWLLRRAFSDPDGSDAGVVDRVRRTRDRVADSIPVGPDSLELELRRAHEALERARDAERQAVAAAQEARDVAREADEIAQAGRERRSQAEQDGDAEVEQRVEQAQRRADEMVARERATAEADVSKQLEKLDDEIAADDARARDRAEQARARAQADIDAAEKQMAEARQLADDAAKRAQEAADEAQRRARALAEEAEADAASSRERADEVERFQREVGAEGAKVVRQIDDEDDALADLDDRTKEELLDLAATVGIKNRSNMRKTELVTAIRRTSKAG